MEIQIYSGTLLCLAEVDLCLLMGPIYMEKCVGLGSFAFCLRKSKDFFPFCEVYSAIKFSFDRVEDLKWILRSLLFYD